MGSRFEIVEKKETAITPEQHLNVDVAEEE